MIDLERDKLEKIPVYYDILHCMPSDPSTVPCSQISLSGFLDISFIVSGSGVHKILGQTIPCKKGDVFIIPSNTPCGSFYSDDNDEMTVRRIRLDSNDLFFGDISTHGSSRYCFGVFHDNAIISYARLNGQTFLEVESLFDKIVSELSECKGEWREAVRAYVSLLLITLGRYVSDTIQNISDIDQSDWRTVSPAIGIIMERFGDCGLTLEEIADTICVSQSHLSRVFRRFTGNTFSQYLRDVRLSHACELLKETSLTVEEIVEQCGLKDIPSFYQSFHNYTGMTPNKYRTDNKKNNYINEKEKKIMVILSEISENLQKGKAKIVKELVQQAIDEGSDPEQILNEGLLAGMNVIGEKFKNNEVYVPEVLVAARAMNMGAQILKPHLAANGVQATGKVCIGTVQGDLHDIGKNLVKMMMEGKGLEVVDLGTDVAPETFVQAAVEQNCQVICCSALLTTTMGVMGDVVKAAEAAGIRDKVKIMVGGAPVTDAFCKEIGADCYTVDAASAADAAVALCKA